MHIMGGPAYKSRPLTRRPPVLTRDCQNTMSTIASNMERGSCESTKARPNSNRRIRNWLVRTNEPRAQGRRPPPDAGTGTRAFNVPAAFSPNPTITGSVIGNRHPSNRSFLQSYPPDEPEYGRTQRDGRNISSGPPSRRPKSALRSAGLCAAPDPRAGMFLPREESGDERRHLNHSDATAATTYKRATDNPVQDNA